MRKRHVTANDIYSIRIARKFLCEARVHLRKAGANNSARYVSRVLKSVDGAENHAERMLCDQNEAKATTG